MNSLDNEFQRETFLSIMNGFQAKTLHQASLKSGWDVVENAVSTIADVVSSATFPAGDFGNSGIERAFENAYMVFAGGLGTKAVYIRQSGYDTHGDQDSAHSSLLSSLNSGLDSFIANMNAKGLWKDTIVYFVSEFSRTNGE
ncbi:MAG: DUF1501 domain-containing protein, partial [Bdellovibrionales bacterium]|nr:DUF1501 domain-containing protein [Bdellovibrionales bacterium]